MRNYLININNTIMVIISVGIAIMLSACTAMNDNYDCPLKQTASCMSLQEMDANVTAEQKQISSN